MRLYGAVLVSAAALYTGGAMCALWRRRTAELEAFCALISALENGIGQMGLPLSAILLPYQSEVLQRCGFLAQVRKRMDEDMGAGAVSSAFDACRSSLALDTEECALLSAFFEALGTEDRTRERQRCACAYAALHARYEAAASALSERCRLSRTLSVSAGGLALLLLW